MLLVDTNIVAYLLIQGDRTAATQELHSRDSDWRSEAFLLVEFTNMLAACIATRRMALALAEDFLATALELFEGKLTRCEHSSVLSVAARYRISAYDARFIALADQLGRRLVTEDARLRIAAPKLTMSLAEALTESS